MKKKRYGKSTADIVSQTVRKLPCICIGRAINLTVSFPLAKGLTRLSHGINHTRVRISYQPNTRHFKNVLNAYIHTSVRAYGIRGFEFLDRFRVGLKLPRTSIRE